MMSERNNSPRSSFSQYTPVQQEDDPTIVSQGAPHRYMRSLEGTQLDHKYRVIKKLAESNMSQIYVAEHLFLGEICALKVIKRPNQLREVKYQRFLQEALLTRRIGKHSANVVSIYDFGYAHKQDVYYYTMELLEGRSLEQVLQKRPGPLRPGHTVSIGIQLCDAMSVAHQEKVLHRDLKPHNIFLTKQKGNPYFHVKLLDFGKAKKFSIQSKDFTDIGKVIGTPQYMAPEQCVGPLAQEKIWGIDRIDERSEIYALGTILYEMLTGQVPFPVIGAATVANLVQVMNRQVHETPVPLKQHRPDLPSCVGEVIDRCLRKDPTHRYQSMKSLQEALARTIPTLHEKTQLHEGREVTYTPQQLGQQPKARFDRFHLSMADPTPSQALLQACTIEAAPTPFSQPSRQIQAALTQQEQRSPRDWQTSKITKSARQISKHSQIPRVPSSV